MISPPRMPSETCPTIDGIIDQIEDVRKANAALRANAEYYTEMFEKNERELEDAQQQIADLEEEIRLLKAGAADSQVAGPPAQLQEGMQRSA